MDVKSTSTYQNGSIGNTEYWVNFNTFCLKDRQLLPNTWHTCSVRIQTQHFCSFGEILMQTQQVKRKQMG